MQLQRDALTIFPEMISDLVFLFPFKDFIRMKPHQRITNL